MAATGKTPILLYGSTTTSNVPVAGNLTNSSDGCEIAINVADKNLFFKDSTDVVNTVPIRQSSTSSNGWLSSTDWNTFNSKQPAGTYVTSVTGTAPVVSSGGTTPAISMAAATGSVNGYLTSTDWTTFNNKSPAAGSSSITTVGTITSGTWNGTAIDVAHGGTGLTAVTAGYIPFGSTSTALSTSSNLFWSAASNKLGINNSSPAFALDVTLTSGASLARFRGPEYAQTVFVGGSQSCYIQNWNSLSSIATSSASPLALGTDSIEAMRIHPSRGVSIGNYTDPGIGNLSIGGNLVIGTSGKGIDFSATAGTGTSELLADYEEGTWTPNQGAGLTLVGAFSSSGTYTKVGRNVFITGVISGGTSVAVSAARVITSNLPFTSSVNSTGSLVNSANTTFANIRVSSSSLTSAGTIAAIASITFSATYSV